jgi:zinc protease
MEPENMHALAITLCSAGLLAGATEKDLPRIPHVAFEKYTLPNGLDVILHEDHSTPIVGVNIWYHVGSKNERPGRTGFAHLFEHMMFQGSKHYDKDYFLPLQQAGGRLNGSTGSDRTNYWETVPANYLELALWMESDRMGFLLPAMTLPKLDNQRDVVKNERRQSYENRPYGLVHETILAAIYPPEHPYSWPTIGSMTDITAASRDDVADFFRHYYHPGNASLCIAGDFQPAEAKRLVAKYFGPLPPGPKVERPRPAVTELKEDMRIEMTDRVGLPRLYLVWHTVPHFATDDAELDVLAHVLAGDKTSRLYRVLVRDKQIAQDVQAAQHSLEIAGQFMVVATARPGHKLAELEAAVAAELKRIESEPPTAEEVARAVNALESQAVRSLEPVSDFGGRADQLNMYNVCTGDPGYLSKDFERFLHVDPQAVCRVAQKYLGRHRVSLEVTPGAERSITPDPRQAAAEARERLAKQIHDSPLPAAGDISEDHDREVLPQPTAEPKFQLPPIQRRKLSNGMEVMVVEKHALPLLNLHVVFSTGRCEDPAEKPGLAAMMASLWDEGTSTRSSEQIAAELAGIGASLSFAADTENTTARLFTLKRQLGKALEVAVDVLRNPVFPQAELERERAMALGRLEQVRNEPTLLAGIAVNQILYGADHPYGRPQFGTAEAIGGLSREDVQNFYRTRVNPSRAAVIAVGDVTADEIVAELEKTLGQWKPAAALAEPNLPSLPAAEGTSLVLVDKPGAAQSVIEVAIVAARRKSPDYFPLMMMNTMLGGQFASRLNLNLREDKGYTYGARSYFDWHAHQAGPLLASASVQTAVTAPAVVEFLKEFEGMAGGRPITAEELEFCRKYITRGFPAGFETSSQIATQLETLYGFGLPDDYFTRVVPAVSAVTADDVLQVAKKYLPLDRLTVVVVGDREKIEAKLRELPIGKKLGAFQIDERFRLKPEEK